MADIGMSIALDTTNLQQGAKAAADSLGEMYDKMAKLQTAGEKKNAIYDYMNQAGAAIQQLVENINGITNLQQSSNNQSGGIDNGSNRTALDFTNQSSRATEVLKNANIDRLKSQVEVVNEKLGEMYDKIKDIDAASNPQGFSSMADSIARLEEVKRGLNGDIAKLENGDKKDNGNSIAGLAKQFMGGGPVGFLGKLGIAGAITAAVVKAIDWGFKTVSGKQQADIAAEGQYLNGDVIGANIAERENSWWTHIPLIGGTIKSGIQVFSTNEDRKTMTELNAWLKESAPSIDTLSLFGNLNQMNASGNSRDLLENYSNAAKLVSLGGTGYSTNDLIESENEYARYGLSQKNAESSANSILKWQRATGAARNELIDFTGYAMRYGASGSATEALGAAYGGLQSSRMEKGQLSEFLRGMQSVMEEGISKGFVIGAEEVSRNMAFLSKLTGGNAMWSGENAARKISGINSSLEQSTSLDSVASVLNLQVAMRNIGNTQSEFDQYVGKFNAGNKNISLYTGTFLDPLMAMEKGLRPETVAGTMEALQKMYNIGFGADGTLTGDVGSAATMLSQMWGLNNTGAVQVLKTWGINGQFTDDDIKKITSDPAMLTRETKAQKAIEDIRVNVQKIAERSLNDGQSLLDKIKEETGAREANDAFSRKAQETVMEAQKNSSAYAPAIPAFDRTYLEDGHSYQNYNPANEKWNELVKAGLVWDMVEVKDMSSPMSKFEWANSDGWGGSRTLGNYEEGLKSGEAYHSKMLTGQEAKGFFFNADDMEAIKEKEAEFRLPDSDGGRDLTEREKRTLDVMFADMYKHYNPNANDAQIARFLQIIADNTQAQNEPITIQLTMPN